VPVAYRVAGPLAAGKPDRLLDPKNADPPDWRSDKLSGRTVLPRLCFGLDKFFPFKPMQALLLRERVGCTESDRKAWDRTGVLIALRAGSGTGVHAQYDDANLVAAMIALEMKRMGIPASRYTGAFGALHIWLRGRSSLDWPRFRIFMTPEQALFQRTGEPAAPTLAGFSLDLGELCIRLFPNDVMADSQLSLPFALGVVK